MTRFTKARQTILKYGAAGVALAMAMGASSAMAEDEDKVSASMGASSNSHFISYGADVWGAGDEFFGDRSTTFVWGDVGFDFDAVTLNLGIWGDINDNVTSGLGGSVQEIDVYASLGFAVGLFGFGVTYQEWYYASDVEGVVDLSVSFDDSELLPISFAPSLTYHLRVDGNGAQDEGGALVFGVGPSFTLVESETYPISLTVPVAVGVFLDDNFQGGTDGGYAYTSGGVSFGIPLAFIDSAFGEWSANLDFIYYTTEADAIPGNAEEDFLTGSIGFSVAF